MRHISEALKLEKSLPHLDRTVALVEGQKQKCKRCLKFKEFTEFRKSKHRINGINKLGLFYTCSDCFKETFRERTRKLNRDRNNRVRFGGLRDVVLERDGYKCVKCGMDNETHRQLYPYGLGVDHIDGGYGKKTTNNTLENLQTLCCVCHSKKDAKRRNNIYTESYLINLIKKWVTKHGKVPSVVDWIRTMNKPYPGIFFRKFGSWKKAIKTAGFIPRSESTKEKNNGS